MAPLVVALLALLVSLAGVALGWLLARARARTAPDVGAEVDAAVARAVASLATERDQAVRSAVDAVVTVARSELGHHTEAASRDLESGRSAIDARLAALHGELSRVGSLVTDLQQERAQQHGQLIEGLDAAARSTHELAGTTATLREALASSRARGQWGERMCEDVLRLAGFVEGVNYVRQTAVAGGGIPDVTFLLPQGRALHMDVKFPADNYLRVLDAVNESAAAAATAQFLRDVRARVREVTVRGYTEGDASLDYVLLFIPNESIYSFVHEHDRDLVDDALRQRVVLCSPFTLFAVLAVVRQTVDAYGVERTADRILDVLGGFTQEWERFSGSVDKLGRGLDTTQRAFDELSGTRRRQLQKHVDRVEELRSERELDVDPPVLRAVGEP
jgi:DNA recombination protein RmuC